MSRCIAPRFLLTPLAFALGLLMATSLPAIAQDGDEGGHHGGHEGGSDGGDPGYYEDPGSYADPGPDHDPWQYADPGYDGPLYTPNPFSYPHLPQTPHHRPWYVPHPSYTPLPRYAQPPRNPSPTRPTSHPVTPPRNKKPAAVRLADAKPRHEGPPRNTIIGLHVTPVDETVLQELLTSTQHGSEELRQELPKGKMAPGVLDAIIAVVESSLPPSDQTKLRHTMEIGDLAGGMQLFTGQHLPPEFTQTIQHVTEVNHTINVLTDPQRPLIFSMPSGLPPADPVAILPPHTSVPDGPPAQPVPNIMSRRDYPPPPGMPAANVPPPRSPNPSSPSQSPDSTLRRPDAPTRNQLPANPDLQNLQRAIDNLNRQIGVLERRLRSLPNPNSREAQNLRRLIEALRQQLLALQRLRGVINQLARNNVLIAIINNAIRDITRSRTRRITIVPRGNRVVIVRAPGFVRPGTVMPLGSGAAIVGSPMGRGAMSGPAPRFTALGTRNSSGSIAPRPTALNPTSITVGNVWQAAGLGINSAKPLSESKLDIARGVVIFNENDVAISFVADDTETLDIQPQHHRTFPNAQQGVVSFDRGTGETARYTVTAGTYEFRATDKGWELYRITAKATIDNSANPGDFAFAVGDKTYTIPAGETQNLTGPYAFAVRFDNGNGEFREKRILNGNVKVAADGAQGTIDLFDAKDFPAASESAPPPDAEPSDPELQKLFAEVPAGLLGPGSTGSVDDRQSQTDETNAANAGNRPLIAPPSE